MFKKKVTVKKVEVKKPVVRRTRAKKPMMVQVTAPIIPDDVKPGQIIKVPAEAREPRLPKWEGAQVLAILPSGHTKTHLHCRVEGGITQHVPRDRFEYIPKDF